MAAEPNPGDLVITTMPGRKGHWLSLVDGVNRTHPLAKFRDEHAVQEFAQWIARNTNIKFTDERNG